MRRAIAYLGVCEQFLALCTVRGQFPPPPQMPPLPSAVWLLTVYSHDILTRLEEYKARITSTLGSILKMDSTKKVTKKLAGTAEDTAAWVTNVGNEHGQVLISVLTCSEGTEGLSPMAAGLMRRYRLAGVQPPQLIYVDRDCCSRDGVSKTAALFQDWGQLVVRLDIWHLMRRFASGVTTETHELYAPFMRQLSHCIFEVDSGDARRLTEAKRSQLEGGQHGMVGLTDAEVARRITREEWRQNISLRRQKRKSNKSQPRPPRVSGHVPLHLRSPLLHRFPPGSCTVLHASHTCVASFEPFGLATQSAGVLQYLAAGFAPGWRPLSCSGSLGRLPLPVRCCPGHSQLSRKRRRTQEQWWRSGL
ncbi:uncharacterized protein LOC144535660 [Sander vitreus]